METSKTDKSSQESPQIPAEAINLGHGKTTQFGPEPKREKQWYVEWEQAKVALAQEAKKAEISGARMEGVTGDLYQKGKKVATFQAEGGLGDNKDQVLMLSGSVKVMSATEKATLTCDRIVYDAKGEVIKAIGHVEVVGQAGSVRTFSELWATPKLDRVATPRMFKNP